MDSRNVPPDQQFLMAQAQQDATAPGAGAVPRDPTQPPPAPQSELQNALLNIFQGIAPPGFGNLPGLRADNPSLPLMLGAGMMTGNPKNLFKTASGKIFSGELLQFVKGLSKGIIGSGSKDIGLISKAKRLEALGNDELSSAIRTAHKDGDAQALSLGRIEGNRRIINGTENFGSLPNAPFEVLDQELRALGVISGPLPEIPKAVSDAEQAAVEKIFNLISGLGRN